SASAYSWPWAPQPRRWGSGRSHGLPPRSSGTGGAWRGCGAPWCPTAHARVPGARGHDPRVSV
ncbi:hypothetical protein EJMLMN_EJMLMN_01580, partial [Dysosmobacter welbionis]